MAANLTNLIRKGTIDTALQVVATTGVRFALIFSLFILSIFISIEDVAKYDLFIVSSSMLLILLTIGLDSGLAIAALSRPSRQAAYLWLSLCTISLIGAILYLPLLILLKISGIDLVFDTQTFGLAYGYAAMNGVMILVFSFYRWIGRAFVASALIVIGQTVGFIVAFILFFIDQRVEAFMKGLLVGAFLGAGLCLVYIFKTIPPPPTLLKWRFVRSAFIQLVRVSGPFGIASGALIGRRAIDRAIIIMIGSPTLLGGYALVSRAGELVAFVFALPALGFAPILVREYYDTTVKNLARILYSGYIVASLLMTLAASLVWIFYCSSLFPQEAHAVAPLFVALVVANLFFTETTVAGFGFIIVKQTHLVAVLSFMFILINLAIAIPLIYFGYGISSVAIGFLIASFVHSSIFVWMSEKKIKFYYKLKTIIAVKLIMASVAFMALGYMPIKGIPKLCN